MSLPAVIAESITDEQIRELRDSIIAEGARGEYAYCVPPIGKLAQIAIHGPSGARPQMVGPDGSWERAAARARCADLINARAAKVSP